MKMKLALCSAASVLTSIAFAGTTVSDAGVSSPTQDAFAKARRPISNPTLFDLALPTTNIHPLYLYHALPDTLNSELGDLGVGGNIQLYALQFEIALNERLSIVATKDGYVDANPNGSVLSKQEGFANLGAGLKYAFILDAESQTAVSGTATLELPTGNSDVFQGEGDGSLNLILSGLKLVDEWQFAGAAGVQLPFDNAQSTEGWVSAHVSYDLCDYFIPLVELNWFHVLDAGSGAGNYPAQVAGNVPAVIQYEGGDLFNLGAVNGGKNRDLVTAAFGFRSRLSESVDVGAAYEIPLTEEQDSLIEDRITVDLIYKF